ncbi:TraR/DksA C4-type zinc finger protein [Rouxiella chamberiensis]|uniref:TraR/DksA C4-type zinc finger protein n=1 Tax=Rouxiella chamberiensis TaxID=1513468 RepID=A0ABY7HNT7_9GAMM|nr:TraR/DksA C4-type zinc finger protein [Rouxiella chamberiensis]WAT01024.1 TraR/DksA C4-type zinc finger protein [Rouxiella chamberiensis]
MSDPMDLEQARQAEVLDAQIKAATSKPVSVSTMTCVDCEDVISAERRATIIGVTRCVDCQSSEEKKERLFKRFY